MRRTVSAIFVGLSLVIAFAAFGVPVNTSWTYQGQLQRSGAAYNGTCNFQFSLWDAASAGTLEAGPLSIDGVNVVNGLFTVVLDFGTSPIGDVHFTGEARWLGTSVQCSGDGGFTPLDPRQPITATPYALTLRPGATINGSEGLTLKLSESAPGPDTAALVAQNNGSGKAIYAYSAGGSAIYGVSSFPGFAGKFDGMVDIKGGNLLFSGLVVTNPMTSGTATAIEGNGAVGVFGFTTAPSGGYGVWGSAHGENSAGVYGQNGESAAIWGHSDGVGSAIFGENVSTGYAGRFIGPVSVEGTLTKSAGSFKIDHPLDPANKFLSHSFVESPDMKNIYDGNVTTDATGSAIVTLPAYFEALNRDFRYQLTVLGQFAQAIVSRKIAGNSFEIRTDKPGIEVSWQVTGIRQDAYARENPIVVEEAKPAEQQGMYLYPAGFGAGEEKRIGHSSRPVTAPGAQQPPATGPGEQGSK